MIDLFTTIDDYGDTLNVRVTPKAAANRVKVEQLADGSKLIKVYVTVAPEHGKANQAVLQLLSKELGIAKSRLEIIKGASVKNKVIKISKD